MKVIVAIYQKDVIKSKKAMLLNEGLEARNIESPVASNALPWVNYPHQHQAL